MKFLLPFASLTIALPVLGAIPAFPGAEGPGAGATGGRGGAVVRVTNLHADGPGSLADAVSQPDRLVVFDVSGIIDLARSKGTKEEKMKPGKIEIAQPNITIAGQTAPGEGICVRGGTLQISASNVIVRHLRARRGWNHEGDMGDALEVKPVAIGEKTNTAGRTPEEFAKIQKKKAERGKQVSEFADLNDILIDHCSTSWATDENLTMTHAGSSTLSWSIAAEGCDYANPKQTPPNHSEGSLWGSAAPGGRSALHHMLYAHNRLRNPRTTGGSDTPPVLTMWNCVVANWSEYATHTGSERVHLDWLHNYYQPGPDTPAELRTHAFEFHGDPGARIFARGNFLAGAPEATRDNQRAIFFHPKLHKLPAATREAMLVNAPLGELPANLQTAQEAYAAVLADAGATLPARDAVDLRIVNGVRNGTGRIIGKETDLAENERWPDYRALPALQDSDGDGLPDFWEAQFGLDANDATDSAKISADGYAHLEHYINNTDPRRGTEPIVSVSATVSRALLGAGQAGEWRFARSGDLAAALTVRYTVSGDAEAGQDFAALPGRVTIPAGKNFATVALAPLPGARDDRTAVVTPLGVHIGCPARALVVIRR